MNFYCQECGAKHEYTSSKPKFCSNCGFNFSSDSKVQSSVVKETQNKKIPRKLEYDIGDFPNQRFDFENIGPPTGFSRDRPQPKQRKSLKDYAQESMKDCLTSKATEIE